MSHWPDYAIKPSRVVQWDSRLGLTPVAGDLLGFGCQRSQGVVAVPMAACPNGLDRGL